MGLKIGVQEFDSGRELEIFLFTTVFRPALNPTQPPIQWEPVAHYLVVKRPEREAEHSSPSSAHVKNA
jgi:tRNA U34 5-methylaminomethyl-2-thiouridine-forming methyltransferase MnmC